MPATAWRAAKRLVPVRMEINESFRQPENAADPTRSRDRCDRHGGACRMGAVASGPPGRSPRPPAGGSGETVYRDHCARCHGARLEGQADWRVRKSDGRLPAPPHNETGHTWHHSDDQLFEITKRGLVPPLAPEGYETDMPAFGSVLSDEQILALLAFIKSRWPAEIRERQNRVKRRASQ
jgi:mono/diheme cytochrome c family protein